MLLDYKLSVRMLRKYPGLTIAGGLALAVAIGIGSAWYHVTGELFHPTLPLPDGDRIVEIQVVNSRTGVDERRLLHDLTTWQRDARLLEDLGAYRTSERNLILHNASPQPVSVAEITASAFRLVRVPPVVGRSLVEADQQPGAPSVVVLGYDVWQRWFGGRADVVGQTLQIGNTVTTVVGVMPQDFAFPINHRLWMPLQVRATGYAPLEGVAVRVFGRLAPGATHAQVKAELAVLGQREAVASPQTHEYLRTQVVAYGGVSPGDLAFELAVTHLPVLLVLLVACLNVATLVYARTATRDAEIATRVAIGASRVRIVAQLFAEALVLAVPAAAVGLIAANAALRWGMTEFYAGQAGGPPFWISPGLNTSTVLYALALSVAGAAILGVLPAMKATSARVHAQLRNLGSGGSTLRFGGLWTTAIIVQVTLTVVCLPPAIGVAAEALGDRMVRQRFPSEKYLAVRIELHGESGPTEELAAAFAERVRQRSEELRRLVEQEPGVVAVTFAGDLPGMEPSVRRAELETAPGAATILLDSLWASTVGVGFFETFERPILAGRTFHEGDTSGGRTVIVNEAFARRFTGGATPVGRRVRYAIADADASEPWFEIVGMVRDVGMTPTRRGEAPYIFHPASPGGVYPVMMGVRVAGDPAALAPRVRTIAAQLDPGLFLDEVLPLDDVVRRVDMPQVIVAVTLVAVVCLGLFLSAAGIFSLMSVSVARRAREIALRSALGAGSRRLLVGVFSRVIVLLGSGIVVGNLAILPVFALAPEADMLVVSVILLITSAVMLMVGCLACLGPARRALRIHPAQALRSV